MVQKEYPGFRPLQIRRLRDRPVGHRRAQPGLLPSGAALPRRLHRHLRRQAGDPAGRDPQRPRRHRVPRPAAGGARRADGRPRRQDHRAGERLELRQHGDHQPQTEAVRRRAGAARPDSGDRPLAGRSGVVEDRERAHGRRHRLSRLAARRDQGRTAADSRVLAGHREIARRSETSTERGRGGGAQLRAVKPQCRSALQICRHLAGRPMEQGRP